MAQCEEGDLFFKENEINILLIGQTGNGKSGTGNSILGHETFDTSDSQSSFTMSVRKEHAKVEDIQYNVVDGPGLKDTRCTTEEDFAQQVAAIDLCCMLCHTGLHAIIFVLNIAKRRFTQEDIDTIKVYKDVLGEDIFKKHCICIFTHGDVFQNKFKEDLSDEQLQEEFMKYVREQEDKSFKTFVEEINYRCLLFRNGKKISQNTKKYQRDMLFQNVRALFSAFGGFDHDKFKEARFVRNEVTKLNPGDKWKADMEMNISIMFHSLKAVQKNLEIEDHKGIERNVNNFEKIALAFLKDSVNSDDIYVNDMRANIQGALSNFKLIRDENKRDRETIEELETYISKITNKRLKIAQEIEAQLKDVKRDIELEKDNIISAQQQMDSSKKRIKVAIPVMILGGTLIAVVTGGAAVGAFALAGAAGVASAIGITVCTASAAGNSLLSGVGTFLACKWVGRKVENSINTAEFSRSTSEITLLDLDQKKKLLEQDKKLRKP